MPALPKLRYAPLIPTHFLLPLHIQSRDLKTCGADFGVVLARIEKLGDSGGLVYFALVLFTNCSWRGAISASRCIGD